MKKILLIIFMLATLAARAQEDSLPPKFLYSVTYMYLNTTRDFKTHVHSRISPLDYNTDVKIRGNGMALGVNLYYIFNPRFKMEVGLLYSTNDYRAVQRNLTRFDTILVDSVKFDDSRIYHMDRMSLPIKVHYNLQEKNFSWYFTGGLIVNRLYSEGIEAHAAYGEFGRGSKVEVTDIYGNSLSYHRYQLDYTAGFGKLIRLSSGLGMKVEGGYTRSAISVLKSPDKGSLSAFYLQLGFITW